MCIQRKLWSFLLLLLIPSLSQAAESTVKLRVAYPTLTASYAVAWIAKEAQIFKKHGLDVELLFIQSSPILVAAMLAGDSPIGLTSGAPAVSGNLSGSDLVLIASLSNVSGIAYVVTSAKITSPAQLKGKIIGIDRLGGTGDFILRRTLRKLAIDPDRDVTIRQVGQSPVRLAALQAGSIDATTITVEDKLAAEKFGLNILIDIPKLGVEVLSSGVVTTRSFIKREEDIVRRFMRSIVEGIHYYRTQKPRSIEIMSRYMRVADPRLIEIGYDFNAQTYRQKPYPFTQGIQLVLEQLAHTNPAAKTAEPERFIDTRFVKELDANGFIDRLYK
jgi:NitT/TauT family transport system substrate-binding protein